MKLDDLHQNYADIRAELRNTKSKRKAAKLFKGLDLTLILINQKLNAQVNPVVSPPEPV